MLTDESLPEAPMFAGRILSGPPDEERACRTHAESSVASEEAESKKSFGRIPTGAPGTSDDDSFAFAPVLEESNGLKTPDELGDADLPKSEN